MADFEHLITDEDSLREIIGEPMQRAIDKQLDHLDEHCRAFIAHSPFCVLASADAHGGCDVSPKGGPPGFVLVLDDRRLAIGDQRGNRRADSLVNLLERDGIGLLFLVPGRNETLRVNGRARLTTDPSLLDALSVHDRAPDLAIGVEVQEAFLHCSKPLIRSEVWEPGAWPTLDDLPGLAEMLRDHVSDGRSLDEVQETIDRSIVERLW